MRRMLLMSVLAGMTILAAAAAPADDKPPRAWNRPGGLAVLLGCPDAKTAIELGRKGRWLVHCLEPNAAKVARVRKRIASAGVYGQISIERVELLPEQFERREDFDLRAFAARSFGAFQEEPCDVVWRFAPAAVSTARSYVFHPTQELEERDDGSLVVRFRAGGLKEMAFHAFTWGGLLEVLEPKELRTLVRDIAEEVRSIHAED